jgi:hypothetical protein
MAIFKKTYQDNLRALKKERACTLEQSGAGQPNDEKQPKPAVDGAVYDSFMFDLSNDEIPNTTTLLYRKNFAKVKHNYTIDEPSIPRDERLDTKQDVFKEVELLIPSIISNDLVVDSDFLTGYYLSKFHMKFGNSIISFHAGLTKDSLIRGIYYNLLKQDKKTKWQMYGCDRKTIPIYNSMYVNGINKPCDIYNRNTMLSINIQLSEKTTQNNLDLYTADIKTTNTADVLKQYMLIKDYIASRGYLILRLPSIWKNCFTSMATLLIFLSSQYRNIKIFKTPWGKLPKYYLLLSDKKNKTDAAVNKTLLAYLADLLQNENLPLMSSIMFDTDDFNYNLYIEDITRLYIDMQKVDHKVDQEVDQEVDHVKNWVDIIEQPAGK